MDKKKQRELIEEMMRKDQEDGLYQTGIDPYDKDDKNSSGRHFVSL